MAEANIDFERSMVAFGSQAALVDTLAPILTGQFGVEFPARQVEQMASKVLHSEEAHPAAALELDLGRFALVMTYSRPEGYVPSFISPYSDLSSEAYTLNEQLAGAEKATPLYRAGILNVNVRDQASAAHVLQKLLEYVPLVEEIEIPEAMKVTKPAKSYEVASTGREWEDEMPVLRRLQIQSGGNLKEYAAQILRRNPDTGEWEGSIGMYRTESGLSVFILGAADAEGTYDMHIYLGSVHNPFVIMYRPLSPDQVASARAMLDPLPAALQDVDI